MTRRRSSAPGRRGPARRRSLPLLVAVAMAVAGCGSTQPSASDGPGSGTPAPTASTDGSGTPSVGSPDASAAPPTDEPSVPATATASASPSGTPASTGGTGPAADCAGNDANRDFYAAVAAAVGWPVYCPVLDDGWHVDTGQYRLAGGGRMEIAYKGPDGARLTFHEGSCATAGCEPTGTDAGPAAFGDLAGRLLQLDGGDVAVVVDPGATPSWYVVGSGLASSEVEAIAAALVRVRD